MPDLSNHHPKSLSRRDFLKITAIAGLAVGLGSAIGKKFYSTDGFHRITSTQYLMGTIVNFNILAPDQALAQEAIRKTAAEMERLIAIFDYRSATTSLGQLNRNGILRNAPTELLEIMAQSQKISALSNGAFDVSVLPIVQAHKSGLTNFAHLMDLVDFRNVLIDGDQVSFVRSGMSVTLDGIAKGRVVDGGVAMLKSMGFENVLVEAGGDMMADGREWKIAVNNPRSANGSEFITTFSVSDKAVTTSGDYLNYFTADFSRHHIIDPRTGESPSELSSATAIAPSAAEADALSTALMVLGVREGLEFIEQIPDTEAFLVTKELAIHKTSGFPIN